MAMILADVGGTNVRLVCARAGAIQPATMRRYENDGHASFYDVLDAFLADVGIAADGIEALAVAVAGPVNGDRARLTNRNWDFDVAELQRRHPGARAGLLNDLSALGFALDSLGDDGLRAVLPGPGPGAGQDQRLVVGVGTGFNVSPVRAMDGSVVCLRAEAGLASLPSRAMRHVQAYLGNDAGWINCVEDVLSGPGLSRLHAAATGGERIGGREVLMAATEGDAAARASLDVFSRVLGEVVQDLRLLYMPAGGIFLAGSAVRGLLDSPSRQIFIDTLAAQPTVKATMPPVGISLITQDEAALLGCLAYALGAA